MLCLFGVDRKTYWTLLSGSSLPEIRCPDPACLGRELRGHGGYHRFLDGVRVRILRARCPSCRVTHALLPEDLCAYQDLTLTALEQAMQAEGPSAAARAAGDSGVPAVRRARRRRRSRLWSQLIALLPAAGTAWERVEAMVGAAPGRLLRLRQWLWSKLRFLLGGPCGLFRHGRPGRATRLRST